MLLEGALALVGVAIFTGFVLWGVNVLRKSGKDEARADASESALRELAKAKEAEMELNEIIAVSPERSAVDRLRNSKNYRG